MSNKKANNKEEAWRAAVVFTDHGWEDYLYWQTADSKLCTRINELIDACIKEPFKGPGKPEPLRGNLTELWSRRINREHRLVYAVADDTVYVLACRYHY